MINFIAKNHPTRNRCVEKKIEMLFCHKREVTYPLVPTNLTTMWNALSTVAATLGLTRPEEPEPEPEPTFTASDFEVSSSGKLPGVFMTGKWRDPKNKGLVHQLAEYYCGKMTLVTAEEEAHGQARFAHKQLADFGYVDALRNKFYEKNPQFIGTEFIPLFVYIGAGRGSAQACVVTTEGIIVRSYYGDGFPRLNDGESYDYDNIAKIWEEIVNDHDEGGCIVSVMMYDAMYYQAKAQHCAIAVDGAPIYDEWNERANCWFETEESYRAIGFGRNDDQISKPSFLCVRNFKTDDDVSKKVHFLPTDKGRYVWDLGSGKMALVDTETGTQMRNIEFPNTVFTDHAALLELVETIRTKSRVYAPIVMDGSWQENASAIAQVEKLLDQKPITLTPEQKCVNKAIFVHKQFRRDGYIQQIVQDHYDDPTGKRQPDPLFVYMMTDGDSAYGIVLLADGEREDVCGVYNADHQNVTSVWEQVLEDHDYKYAIQHVILLDDLYRNADTDHVHKEGAPLYDSWDGVEMGDWLYRESDFKNIGFYVTDAKGYKGGTRSSCPSFLPLSSFQTGDYEDELIMRYPHPLPTEHNSVWRMESEMLSLVHTPTGETLWACEIDPTQDIRQIIDPILNEAHP